MNGYRVFQWPLQGHIAQHTSRRAETEEQVLWLPVWCTAWASRDHGAEGEAGSPWQGCRGGESLRASSPHPLQASDCEDAHGGCHPMQDVCVSDFPRWWEVGTRFTCQCSPLAPLPTSKPQHGSWGNIWCEEGKTVFSLTPGSCTIFQWIMSFSQKDDLMK